jgi:DinB superfamily
MYGRSVPGKRADTLLKTMRVIEYFTLGRAWTDLSDEELFWEPVAGSWGVRRRAECRTPTPFGDGDWVVDFDADLVMAAIQGKAVEPLTTIGWLMWHVGSMPERLAQLDFLGGSKTTDSGWTSPYLTAHRVFTNAADAVESMRAGWRILERSLQAATDDALEQPTRRYSYSDKPGPLSYGAAVIAGTLNEVSHHGAQICTLRDLYRIAKGRPLSMEREI